jgi:PAS domain S-box-containing protein
MEQFWENLQELLSVNDELGLEDNLSKILSIGKELSGAEIVAIYLANDQDPGFQCYGSIDPQKLLPATLPAQDIIHLRKSQEWTPGKRYKTKLHDTARNKNLVYFTSAPIGQLNAIIGLVIIADTKNQATDYTLQITKLLAITMTTIIQDHLQRLQIKEELNVSDYRRRSSLIIEEQVHEGIIFTNPDLRIIKINISAEMMLGYKNEEVVGHQIDDILITTEPVLPSLKDAQRGNSNFNLGELRAFRRNGDTFSAHIRTIPVKNGNGIDGIIVLIADLSEIEKIQLHAKELEKRSFLGELTSIFAHEARNSINNISTTTQRMAYNLEESDPSRPSLDMIQQECERMEALMKSVLSFSRSSELDMEMVNLPALITHLLQRLRPRITSYNVEDSIKIAPECPNIRGNPRALEQVFTNLVTNALQVMRDTGGKLAIKVQPVRTPENRLVVETSVADTGPGIPPEILAKIFEPYYTTEKSGTGLGLAIASRIIEAHKGTIEVKSFPGGSVFQVRLPGDNYLN